MEVKTFSKHIHKYKQWLLICLFVNLSNITAQIDSVNSEIRNDSTEIEVKVVQIKIESNLSSKIDLSKEVNKKVSIKNLPYFMDDLMMIGGLNQSTLAYSIDHRDISYQRGFQIGFEDYTPITEKGFMHFGLMYAQRGFRLRENHFFSYRLETPLIFAFELPEFRNFDFRFLLGTQISAQVASSETGQFLEDFDYRYRSNDFNKFDFGFTAGISGEYRDYYLRMRTYFGANALIKNDSATIAFFQFEFGYFLFRRLRAIPAFQ
jgi:hypothetical protein